MNVWRVIAATFVIFLAGVLSGVVASGHFRAQGSSHAAHESRATLPEHTLWPRSATNNVPPQGTNTWKRLTTDFMSHFGKQLELTDDQASKIEAIITDGQKRTKAISDQLQPKVREEMKNTRELIRNELNPDQRRKFDEIYKGKPSGKKTEKKPVGAGPRPVQESALRGAVEG